MASIVETKAQNVEIRIESSPFESIISAILRNIARWWESGHSIKNRVNSLKEQYRERIDHYITISGTDFFS